MALALENTGMVVTTDVGNPKDIHPTDKKTVGHRLALWALAETYGREDITCSGPLYESMEVDGDRIRLRFTHVGDGLVAKDGALTHFTIAGADRRFVSASAVIEGDTVVVSSPEVPEPVAVRFAYEQAPEPNFFNAAGLPASPFRMDEW
jgi:sialate O-acetylesterase